VRRLKSDLFSGIREARWTWYFALYLLPTVGVALVATSLFGWDLDLDSNPPWYGWLFITAASLLSLYLAGARLGTGDELSPEVFSPQTMREYWLGIGVFSLNYSLGCAYLFYKIERDPDGCHTVRFSLGRSVFTMATESGWRWDLPKEPPGPDQTDGPIPTQFPGLRLQPRRN